MGFFGGGGTPALAPRASEAEIERKAEELREKERLEAEKVKEQEKLDLMKRKGRGKTILTGAQGILEEAPVKRKTLLGE